MKVSNNLTGAVSGIYDILYNVEVSAILFLSLPFVSFDYFPSLKVH